MEDDHDYGSDNEVVCLAMPLGLPTLVENGIYHMKGDCRNWYIFGLIPDLHNRETRKSSITYRMYQKAYEASMTYEASYGASSNPLLCES
jgi:hypothetical protein